MHDITDSIQSNLMALFKELISLPVFGVACRRCWNDDRLVGYNQLQSGGVCCMLLTEQKHSSSQSVMWSSIQCKDVHHYNRHELQQKLSTEVRTQTHVFRKTDSAAGMFVTSNCPCCDSLFLTDATRLPANYLMMKLKAKILCKCFNEFQTL